MSRLLSLPIELQEEIVMRVGKGSLEGLFNLKVTCKTMKEVSESSIVYESIDLFSLTEHQCIIGAPFMTRCYESRNLSAIYIKGTQDYFIHSRRDEGLHGIKLAADGGCEIALYTYVMIRRALHEDGACLSQITKESVRRMSSTILEHRMGLVHLLHDLATKRSEFLESILPEIYGYECSPHVSWYFWFRNGIENYQLCDGCFWSSHLGIFYNFFSVMKFPETRLW